VLPEPLLREFVEELATYLQVAWFGLQHVVRDVGSQLLVVSVVAPPHPLRLDHRLRLVFQPVFPGHPVVFLDLRSGFFRKVV
jgi:hypothetical protein